jgi:hypothetical protein
MQDEGKRRQFVLRAQVGGPALGRGTEQPNARYQVTASHCGSEMTRSQPRTAVVMLLLTGFAGCAAPKPPELDYLPPSSQPAPERSAFVRQQPWLVWGNILDHLQQQDAQVSIVDEAGGKLVVFYNGDPQPYVDCGWIVTYRGDELDRVPAAASDASFLRRRDGEVVTLERELRLDARMRVDVEPSGDDAIVRTDSTYMLTKSIGLPGVRQPLHAETIDFHTGESEAFSSGTACQPTGELERLVFAGLPAVSLAGN